jgi:hypothetical protein
MCVAIIARENAILARFRKRESFGWAVYPLIISKDMSSSRSVSVHSSHFIINDIILKLG